MLTEKARDQFPNNYQRLAEGLLERTAETSARLKALTSFWKASPTRWQTRHVCRKAILTERLDVAVDYLTERGYEAIGKPVRMGYVLHTSNCPYHHISEKQPDAVRNGYATGRVAAERRPAPHRPTSAKGDETCSYLIPDRTAS